MGNGSSVRIAFCKVLGSRPNNNHIDNKYHNLTGKVEKIDSERIWKITVPLEMIANMCGKNGVLSSGTERFSDQIELRTVLNDTIGQKYIGTYSKQIITHESFFAWIEIQEFRSIPTADYLRGMAVHIYRKYIKENSVLQLGCVVPSEREEIKAILDLSKNEIRVISQNLYDKIQQKCFMEMYHNTFLRFKQTGEYTEMQNERKRTYNRTGLSDFDFMDILGEGGYGRVLHVRKKSTMAHMAMKIQLKSLLLNIYSDDVTRINHERRVFGATFHPFIVGMHYAFQTDSLVVMVLDIVTCGNLQEALDNSIENRLSEKRVQFYAAEIILALVHLHDLGLMYRDLKPCNVLLSQDGHIKLTDMGGVAEFASGTCLDQQHQTLRDIVPELGKSCRSRSEPNIIHGRHRRSTIMGTNGYMAPEMVILQTQTCSVQTGYTYAVDFWSLGVTIYKLLTGNLPIGLKKIKTFLDDAPAQLGQNFKKFDEILAQVYYPSYVSPAAVSVINGLLQGDELKRLGSTFESLAELKAHQFFSGCDWIKLSVRHMIPPYIPEQRPLREVPRFSSLDDCLKFYNKRERTNYPNYTPVDWTIVPDPRDQIYFKNWDFVSMQTLKIEMGIANELMSHDMSFKVQMMMGTDSH